MKSRLAAVCALALLFSCGSPTPAPELDSAGEKLLTTSPGGHVRFGPQYFEFTRFFFAQEPHEVDTNSMTLTVKLGDSENYLLVPIVQGKPTADVKLIYRKSIMPLRDVRFEANGPESVTLFGRLETGVPLLAEIHSSAGSSTFRLAENRAYLNGELGSGTYRQVEYLISKHPEIDTIVFENVPGSLNDEVNVFTGRLIRNARLETAIPAYGVVASGGVSLFCAGVKRTVEAGAQFGVHAWSIPGDSVKPALLPRDHHAHRAQLSYHREMLERGEEFYFFTLKAAPFESVYWLTPEDILKFGLEK